MADELLEPEEYDAGTPMPEDDFDLDPATFLHPDDRGLEVVEEPLADFEDQDGTDDDEPVEREGEGGGIPSYVRSIDDACAWGRSNIGGPAIWYRLCLRHMRMCPNVGSGASYAYQAWDQCPTDARRPYTSYANVLRGAGFIWSNSGAGHAVHCLGGGLCTTNDYGGSGRITVAPLANLGPWCGGRPDGQIFSVNGVRFMSPGTKPKPELGKVSLNDVRRAHQRDADGSGQHITAGAKADVLQVEKALHARAMLGAEFIDGSFGEKTRAAYLHFERDIGVPKANGVPGPFSLARLGKGRFQVVK